MDALTTSGDPAEVDARLEPASLLGDMAVDALAARRSECTRHGVRLRAALRHTAPHRLLGKSESR